MSDPLARLAARASLDPTFLGHLLSAYAARHGLTDVGLAFRLGCSVADLVRLRLCGAPRPGDDLAAYARVAATHVGADPERLREVLGDG